jgi:hypothetical protein
MRRPCRPQFPFFNPFDVVIFLDVLRENRSGVASGAKAALDQGPVAVESGLFFDEGTDFRFAAAHSV